jgi:sugar lactone lactonase YvrE
MTVVIVVGRAARATAESTTSSQNVILAGRHVDVAASKTRKVDTCTTAGEGKSLFVVSARTNKRHHHRA